MKIKTFATLTLAMLLISSQAFATDEKKSLIEMDFDETKAAAEQGDPGAQYWLGIYYFIGEDTLVDPKKSLYWTEKAANQGHAGAQSSLGQKYYFGNGVSTDKSKAAYWVKKGYESGAADAKNFWDTYDLWKYE